MALGRPMEGLQDNGPYGAALALAPDPGSEDRELIADTFWE